MEFITDTDVSADDRDNAVDSTEFDQLPDAGTTLLNNLDGSMEDIGSVSALRDFQSGVLSLTNGTPKDPTVSNIPAKRKSTSSGLEEQSFAPRREVFVRVPTAKFQALPYATGRSGLVYDARMRFHQDVMGEKHPEDPARIAVIFNKLIEADLVADAARPETEDSDFQLVRIIIRAVTDEEVLLVHTAEHLAWVKQLPFLSEDQLVVAMLPYASNSVYVNNLTWLSASLSAGGAIEATKAVLSGQVRNSIALVRPPGHHAEAHHPEGFCLFNNVCIAARVAQRDYPEIVRKVLILDWDVHHGNGIQRAFYDDPNVLYISVHLYEDGKFYPSGPYGDRFHCGEGLGLGRNVNIPWRHAHMGDGDYIYAFQQVVMPIAVEFDPDLVFISAGFDAADGDPLGECHVSPACYGHMTHLLMQLAKGKVVSCLEGGYNLDSIAKSALSMTRVMMGEPPDRMAELKPTKSGVRDVGQVVRQQAKFWKSMYPRDRQLEAKKELGSQRLHDIIRDWQANVLFDQHRMVNLFVLRNKISKSYQNQVLATENFRDGRPLLMVFHDPPEVTGQPDPRTSELQLHNTFLTDVSKRYIDWAVQQGFAAIDVNVPKHYTKPEDDGEYAAASVEHAEDSDNEAKRIERSAQVRELAEYLWQNYIEPWDARHVFLMGVGDSYKGLLDLLATHPGAMDRVDLVIGFVGADFRLSGIPKDTDSQIQRQYYLRSEVFVGYDHGAFDPNTKPLKKRFGRLHRSPENMLQEMMHQHQSTVTDRILNLTEDWREEYSSETQNGQINGHLDPATEREIIDELEDMDVSQDHPEGGRYY